MNIGEQISDKILIQIKLFQQQIKKYKEKSNNNNDVEKKIVRGSDIILTSYNDFIIFCITPICS